MLLSFRPRFLAAAFVLLFQTGCAIGSASLSPQSHYAYPNSNVKPFAQAQGSTSRLCGVLFVNWGSPTGEDTQKAIQQALQRSGGDLLINMKVEASTFMVPMIFSQCRVEVTGTAATMTVGRQYLGGTEPAAAGVPTVAAAAPVAPPPPPPPEPTPEELAAAEEARMKAMMGYGGGGGSGNSAATTDGQHAAVNRDPSGAAQSTWTPAAPRTKPQRIKPPKPPKPVVEDPSMLSLGLGYSVYGFMADNGPQPEFNQPLALTVDFEEYSSPSLAWGLRLHWQPASERKDELPHDLAWWSSFERSWVSAVAHPSLGLLVGFRVRPGQEARVRGFFAMSLGVYQMRYLAYEGDYDDFSGEYADVDDIDWDVVRLGSALSPGLELSTGADVWITDSIATTLELRLHGGAVSSRYYEFDSEYASGGDLEPWARAAASLGARYRF